MKHLFYYIVACAFGLCSCGFLDTETYDYLEQEELYHTESNCLAGLMGVYDALGAVGCYGQNLWADLDAGTDILVYNRSYGKDYIQVSNYNYNNTDNALKSSWTALYEGINRANDYIGLITQRTDEECGSAAKKAMFIAEAKALRALFYMNLVAFWGEVPLRTTPTDALRTQLLKKSPQADNYQQHNADHQEPAAHRLFFCVTLLTSSDDFPFSLVLYYGTKYLFRLYEEGDERQWWNIADYKYVTTNGIVTEVERTTSEKASEEGNAAKWRAKYIPERPLSRNNSSINFPVVRYSDVLLMLAECENEVNQGPTPDAINALNQVRLRAGASEVNRAQYATYESFKQLVRDERTRELCFEVPRRMELRRHGVAYFESQLNILKDQSLNEKNKKIGYDLDNVKAVPAINYARKHIYFPIPQVELNVNTICGQTDLW